MRLSLKVSCWFHSDVSIVFTLHEQMASSSFEKLNGKYMKRKMVGILLIMLSYFQYSDYMAVDLIREISSFPPYV